MTSYQDKFECYDKTSPKWLTVLIALLMSLVVYFFIPNNSWTFYLGIGMCSLLIILTLTHKKSTNPKLTIDRKIIKTTYGQTFNINAVINAELMVKGKWARHKSHYIKLFFTDKSSTEFPVGGLDTSPQNILEIIKAKIST